MDKRELNKPEEPVKLIPEDVWEIFTEQYLRPAALGESSDWPRTAVELWYAHGEQLIQEYEARQSAGVTLEEFYE